MAPPKKGQQKMSLGDFLGDQSLGSWADEMEDMPVTNSGKIPAETAYPAWALSNGSANMLQGGGGYGGGERRTFGSAGGGGFGTDRSAGGYADRGFAIREELPLPSKPPYTAHLGNLSFDAMEGDIQDFFADCAVTNVRIVEDKMERKPKGFGYVEFGTLDGLKKALDLSGTQFQGRNIRVSVAEPPKDRAEQKDMSDWTRKGPLPDLPGRRPSDRGGGFSDRGGGGFGRNFDAGSDAGSEAGGRRRPPPFADDGKVRDFGNWERKGPLSPVPGSGPMREGGRVRSNDGPRDRERRQSPAWGEGRSQDGSRPPRREFQERPAYERKPTEADMDNQWRSKMRPDAPAKSPSATPETSTPSSPAAQPAVPATRRPLQLQKRTVSEAAPAPASASSNSKSNPFGAARPVDTDAREKEIQEKKDRQKAEAEKAREEKRAKDAADKAAAREKSSVPPTPTTEKKENGDGKPPARDYQILQRTGDEAEAEEEDQEGVDASANGNIVQDKAVKPQEPVREPSKSTAPWRKSSTPAAAPAETTTEKLEDDGWNTVPNKNKKGRGNARALAS